MNFTEKEIILKIPSACFDNKNELLGSIIRRGTEAVRQSDIPGELTEYWNEVPLSKHTLKEIYWINDRQLFEHHFNKFKDFIKNTEGIEITSLTYWVNPCYSMSVCKRFFQYMSWKNHTQIKSLEEILWQK